MRFHVFFESFYSDLIRYPSDISLINTCVYGVWVEFVGKMWASCRRPFIYFLNVMTL